MNQYAASVIIPAFNSGKTIVRCLKSLISQTFNKSRFEVLVINDGSTDETLRLCYDFAKQNPGLNLRVITQKNSGVSAARNKGIEIAKGDYLFFLDSDDEISENTVKEVVSFFEAHHEKIDIVTYTQSYKGQKTGIHYRYKQLHETGVYDTRETRCISLSNPNYCIKKGERTRFDEKLKFHEDELFAANVALRQNKIGYVKEATYFYYFTSTNTVNTRANPVYIHDDSINMYESLCELYANDEGVVSPYIQDMIINDFSWKLRSNNLWPIHLELSAYTREAKRIVSILNKIDNKTILNHVNIDKFHKHYFLGLKTENRPFVEYDKKNDRIVLKDKSGLEEHCKGNEIFITRIVNRGNGLVEILGFLKTYISNYTNNLGFYYSTDTRKKVGVITDVRSPFLSIHSYYRCKTLTSNFPFFRILINSKRETRLDFHIGFQGHFWQVTKICNFRTSPLFNTVDNKNVVGDSVVGISDGCLNFKFGHRELQKFSKKLSWQIWLESKKHFALRLLTHSHPIWLYVDRHGVFDNAFYQFKADISRNDGVKRYYVYDDNFDDVKEKFSIIERSFLVKHGSLRHILLFLHSEKVFTSFVDEEFFMPMKVATFNRYYRDKNKPEFLYLQHGVLNAKTIHYSNELLLVDKITISTKKEREQLILAAYSDQDLLLTGMSRFDSYVETNSSLQKILWAPSWRRYLIGSFDKNTNRWQELDIEKIKKEEYFASIERIVNDEVLNRVLRDKHIVFEIKLHPIVLPSLDQLGFRDTENFKFIREVCNPNEYSIVITDFSSYVFDFVLLNKKIVIFVPDEEKVQAGMSLYNEFFITPRELTSSYCTSSTELVDCLCESLMSETVINDVNKCNLFCFNKKASCCDAIYKQVKNGHTS